MSPVPEPALELRVKDSVYVVPLKESKQMVSLRVLPEALRVLDKFCALSGEISRTRLIEKLVETLALAIHSARYKVKSIVLVVADESGGAHFGAVVFNPGENLDDIRKRLYRALLG